MKMNLVNLFLPEHQKDELQHEGLRVQAMLGFILFYFVVICPLLLISIQATLDSFYGIVFTMSNAVMGLGSLIFVKKTGDYRRTALFLCTWCVGVGVMISLEAEVFFTPLIYWLPFLLTFVALQSGLRGSLAFLGMSFTILLGFTILASGFDIPQLAQWPRWGKLVLTHIALAQMAFYSVIFAFEILRESDRSDLERQKLRLMESAKVQSTRSLNRLMEKKIQACVDANRDLLSSLDKHGGKGNRIGLKSLEILEQKLDNLCQTSDHLLDEAAGSMIWLEFTAFMEELLQEDPQFRQIDFHFKLSSDDGILPIPFRKLYPLVESILENLIQPWKQIQNLQIGIRSDVSGSTVILQLRVMIPQGEAGRHHYDAKHQETGPLATAPWRAVIDELHGMSLEHSLSSTAESINFNLVLPFQRTNTKAV